MRQLPLPIGPEPQPSFENFVPGANAAALAHLSGAMRPGTPVYLWGPTGSGKTHLLRAYAAACRGAGQVVGWFESGAGAPWPLLPAWTAVVIDGCEALDADAQHAAFTLFVESMTHGVQVVAAGRLPPVDLPLREDLRTRLAWGYVYALQPLGDAETRAVLRREADRRGLLMADEVIDHMLTRGPRDMTQLMRLLDRLDIYALAEGRRLTLPLLRRMRSEEAGDGGLRT